MSLGASHSFGPFEPHRLIWVFDIVKRDADMQPDLSALGRAGADCMSFQVKQH